MVPHADDEPRAPRTLPPPRVGRVGQRVGPFLLVERLELAEVIGLYRASRPAGSRQPREVAIRIVEDARDDRAAAWVRHEYDILRRLDHPAIPQAFGYYSSQVGVALSLPPTIRLDQVLEARRAGRVPLEPATALDLVCEVAEALRHAHAIQGPDGPICHRHLSPATVGLHHDGTVAVLGFGAAPSELPFGYRPPEQVAGAFVDARSDQWRLGALTVELLLGTPLYADLDDPAAAATEGAVGPWIARIERRHPEIARVVAKLLSPAAGSRYEHDNTLVRDLLEAVRLTGGRPDRRALVSRMRAIQEADARRAAEAAAPAPPAEAPEPPRRVQPVEPEFQPAPELPLDVPEPTPVAATTPPIRARTEAPPARESSLRTAPAEAVPAAADLPEVELDPEPPEVVVESDREPDSVDPFSEGDLDAAPLRSVAPESDPFADPASMPEPVVVAYTEDDDDDDPSLGLGRLAHPSLGGPSLGPMPGPAADDPIPAGLSPDDATESWNTDAPIGPSASAAGPTFGDDPALEVTEVIDEQSLPVGERPVPAGPRPSRWFPSELAAMAAIGVALIVAIVFMAWRFG